MLSVLAIAVVTHSLTSFTLDQFDFCDKTSRQVISALFSYNHTLLISFNFYLK